MEPKFDSVLSLLNSDPLSARIDGVLGTDYQNYIHCRSSDSKAIPFLIGKSVDRFAQHSVDWGRQSEGKAHGRTRVDRTSGLYLTGTRKSAATPANKGQPHPERKAIAGQAASECAEDERLRNDLQLSSSDDEDAPGLNCTPNDSQHSARDSSQSHGIRDLSYWVKKGSEKLEKKAPNSQRKAAGTVCSPKEAGNYRELVKNGLDSLRSARRTTRMLSVLNDTDDEGERKECKGRGGDLKQRKSFVDCRMVGKSPKRELVAYSDLNEEDEDEEEAAVTAPNNSALPVAAPAVVAKPKTPPVKREEQFRFEARGAAFHVAFPVPPLAAGSPSHRKRPRRHADAVSPASNASPATDPMVDPTFERNLSSDGESEEPVVVSPAAKNLFQALPKIPRKRPNPTAEADATEAKKKARLEKPTVKEEEMVKTEEPREVKDKLKEKKARHKTKERKIKEPEPVKREAVSPLAPIEMSVSFEPSLAPTLTMNPRSMDSLAPSLPRVTEVATQCELIPPVERDPSETKDTKRLRAVAFRIEARAGASSQAADASGGSSQAAGVTRRPSSASTTDEGEAASRRGDADDEESRAGPRCSDLLDAVMRHKRQQESIVQRENVYYMKMNANSCFSDALDKKVEADRLKGDDPSRFALCALRACFLYIQACYVEERQSRSESASIHYRETVAYVRSTSQLIEQVAKAESSGQGHQRARVRHNFITLLCAQMKAVINYRIYSIGHRETARLRPEIERELHRLTTSGGGNNGASERSTPESISRSPAGQQALQLSGDSLHRLQRYFRYSRAVQTAHEYWIHATTLRAKHEELGPLEELVFRKAQVVCYGPECPVPCFLRYLNTFLTLYEEGEV